MEAETASEKKARIEDLSVWSFVMAGIIAGLLAGVLNNAWMSIFPIVTSYESGPAFVDAMSVSFLSFSPMLLGAFIYYFLCNISMNRGTRIFMIVGGILFLISLYVPFNPELITDRLSGPNNIDGFLEMTLPMHFISGAVGVLFIPWMVYQNR